MAFPNDPNDVNAPAYTGGSTLGDFLAGAGGANISRPAIGLQIANGQATAGYRSAQTELALQKAQQNVEREQAMGQLQDQLVNAGMKPSGAAASVGYIRATGRDPLEIMKTLSQGDERELTLGVADPNTPEPLRQAYLQALSKKGDVGQTQNVEGQLVNALQPGKAPTVTQTPVSQSVINKNNAEAQRAGTQSQMDPEIAPIVARFIDQNPNLAANMRSLTNGGGPLVAAAYMAEHGDAGAADYLARKAGQRTGAAPAAPGAAPGAPPGPPVDVHGGAPTSSASQYGAPVPFDGAVTDPHQIILPAPGVSLKEQADIRHDYANSKGAGGRVGFINTMSAHSRLFDLAADELRNGNVVPSNAFQNLWVKTFGGAAPTNLHLIGEFLGREAVRATINSGSGTGEERELSVSNNASPEQLHDAARLIRTLGAHQLRTLDNGARRGGVNILQLLDPQTRTDMGMLGGSANPTPVTGAAPGAGGGTDLAALAQAELAKRAGAQ